MSSSTGTCRRGSSNGGPSPAAWFQDTLGIGTDGDAVCWGIPTDSCTAFRDHQLSLLDPSACVSCEGDPTAQLAFLIAFLVVAVLLLVATVGVVVLSKRELK